MGQMCIALKAAEWARAAEQESWAAKEIEWAKEKANLLEAYEKCRQGLERAVWKLKEENEKQAATRDPTPAGAGETNPEPTRRAAATSGPSRSGSPPREAAKSELRDLGTEPRWREERWRRERGMEHRDGWERTRGGPVWAKDRRPPGKRWGDRRGSSPDPRERRRW